VLKKYFAPAVLACIFSISAHAETRCEHILKAFGDQLADATCFQSTDLTTNNPLTTPANNSILTLPAFAFTPVTDRGVIAPSAAKRPPITVAVPGVQIQARIADDPTGQARFLLRLPDSWNGRLVVAGASGTRSEFNGDFAWSDYVVQQGFAYASQNKGVLNLQFTTSADPLGCRLNPSSPLFVSFYDNGPGQQFTRWTDYMVKAGTLGRTGVKAAFGNWPRYTYAVGTSNGGYQVRRALETASNVFDGGVDWEGTFVDEAAPNLLTDLPPAILNWPDYVASLYNPTSTAAKNILAAGYAPDIVLPSVPAGASSQSLWGNYSNSFWEVTQCQWQKRFDPTWVTYPGGPSDITGTGGYNYFSRAALDPLITDQLAAVATTGKIKRPLITVAGTMDALLPIKRGARAYEALVNASRKGNNEKREAQYRLYEVQNGNHIETYKDTFTQLEFIQPHAQKAFDLLVQHVENNAALPPSQCVPRGGAIAGAPTQPGHCASLFVP